MSKEISKTRVNITMSDEMVQFYQEMADEMGIPRSTAMIIALKTYKDQQQMLLLTRGLDRY